jgi:hypothetical protein
MTTKRKTDYNIGDRVAERPKSHGIFAGRNEVKDRIQQYRSSSGTAQWLVSTARKTEGYAMADKAEVPTDPVGSPQESH